MQKLQRLLILTVLASSALLSACQDSADTPAVTTNPAAITAPVTIVITTIASTSAPSTTSTSTTAAAPTSGASTTTPTAVTRTTAAIPPVPGATTTTSSNQAGSFTLAKVEELPIQAVPGTDLYLSPDGRQIFWLQSDKYCFYSAAGQKGQCGELGFRSDPNSVNWSPDSKWIVLTENFFKFFNEPDIWVLEAASGKLTNLTDDNLKGGIKLGDTTTKYTLDLSPGWSRDGKQIFFLRYDMVDPAVPTLYSIGVTGGTPSKLGLLKSSPGFSTFVLRFSPDGKRLAYNVAGNQADGPDNGLWLTDDKGQNPKQIYKTPAPASAFQNLKNGPPYDLAFSADSRYLLAFSPQNLGSWDTSSNQVVTLDGQETPVDTTNAAHFATWSPTGAGLAYIVRNGVTEIKNNTSKAGLYVVDKPGGSGRLVHPGEFLPPYRGANWRGLTWAGNNTILVMDQKAEKFYLVHLETK